MTEAVKQICGYVFDKSDIIRIYAEPFTYNTASCCVEKAGFQYEGALKSNAVKNGEVIDMKMYSLLKTEISFPAYRADLATPYGYKAYLINWNFREGKYEYANT